MFCLTDVMFVTECECDYVNGVGSLDGNGAKSRKTLSLNILWRNFLFLKCLLCVTCWCERMTGKDVEEVSVDQGELGCQGRTERRQETGQERLKMGRSQSMKDTRWLGTSQCSDLVYFNVFKVIQSDQQSNFTSHLFAGTYKKQLHINQNKSTVFHVQNRGHLNSSSSRWNCCMLIVPSFRGTGRMGYPGYSRN